MKMKKTVILPLLLLFTVLLISTSVFAASVSRDMASRVSAGEKFTVTLSASGVPVGELFTIEDQAPQGWLVSNWQVSGAEGGREAVDYRFVAADNRPGWSFTASASAVTVTYDVKVPNTASSADYKFDAVYFDSSGQGRNQGSVTVRTIACGDGVCEGSENSDTCVQDCPVAPPAAPSALAEPGEKAAAGVSASTVAGLLAVIVVLAVAAFFYTRKKKK